MEEESTPLIEALRRERKGYVAAGKDDRVKEVDAVIKRLGGTVAPGEDRTPRRPRKQQETPED